MIPSYHMGLILATAEQLSLSGPILRPAEYYWVQEAPVFAAHIPRRGGWVVITEQEFTELGIPERSRRGLFDTSFTDLVLVDRRCLKRYRRKAGRR